MPLPEEVDEINEYLKARRKKQELGELPRQDLTPSFVKRMSNALFGEKAKPKVPLQSMQPTYASPVAQSAVRKQLDEIMQERTTKPNPSPLPASVRAAAPTPPRPLPPIPRYPESNVWVSAAKPTASPPPRTAPLVRTPTPVPIPTKSSTSSAWGFWNMPKTSDSTPTPATSAPPVSAPARIPTPVSPPIIRTSASSATTSAPAPVARTSAFPSYTSIAATPPKPYQEIPPLTSKGPTSPSTKVFDPISSVRAPPTSPTAPSMNPSSPIRAESTPATLPARAGYAPPWVTRTVPKPGITPALPSKQKQMIPISTPAQLEIAPPASPKKNNPPTETNPSAPRNPEFVAPSASSMRGKPWVTGVLPKEAGEDFAPARLTPISTSTEERPSPPPTNMDLHPPEEPVAFARHGSGEVRVDELTRATKRNTLVSDVAPPSHDAALSEEISEEEAIDRLPFEEVEGLSDSDLAYLERKEKEHAQTHDEELDQGDPAALRAHLETQTQKLRVDSPVVSGEDPKKEILRRLKKMMEENPPHS